MNDAFRSSAAYKYQHQGDLETPIDSAIGKKEAPLEHEGQFPNAEDSQDLDENHAQAMHGDIHLKDFLRGNASVTVIRELCQILKIPAIMSHLVNTQTLGSLEICQQDELSLSTPKKVVHLDLP